LYLLFPLNTNWESLHNVFNRVGDWIECNQSAIRRSITNKLRDTSIGSRPALLQVRTCSFRGVVALFSHGKEKRGFDQRISDIRE
jgi:hypothetical protein